MKYRELWKGGFKVSEIGLGCWQLGGDWGDPVAEEQAMEILNAAVNEGVTLFDTADVYGGGRSEELIGRFLKENPADIKVITKFGRGAGIFPDNYSEKSLREGVEASLQRLQLNSLDLLQLHCIPFSVLQEGSIFDLLRKIREEGLIKEFGVSIETEEEALLCMQQEELVSVQVIFNVFRQHYVESVLREAKERGIGIIVRLPLASGLLTGKFTSASRFDESDHRNYNRDGKAFNAGETFSGLPFEKGLDLVSELQRDFLPQGMSMVEFALRWILDQEGVSCAIPGASSVKQVRSNARISEVKPLPTELLEELYDFYQNRVRKNIRGRL